MPKGTIRLIFVAVTVALSLQASAASNPGPVMRQALQLSKQGEYERAALLYEGLIGEGVVSAALYYNLGNCYYQTGQTGKSVLNFERAALLQPGNPKVRNNLRLARARVAGEPLSWPGFAIGEKWGSIRGLLSPNNWALAGLAACWLALAGWLFRRRTGKMAWSILAWTFGLLAVSSWLLSWSGTQALESDYSIVMKKEVEVLVGPDPQSGELSTVYEGWKVKRLDLIGDWVKVELPDGQEGWVKKEVLEAI